MVILLLTLLLKAARYMSGTEPCLAHRYRRSMISTCTEAISGCLMFSIRSLVILQVCAAKGLTLDTVSKFIVEQ